MYSPNHPRSSKIVQFHSIPQEIPPFHIESFGFLITANAHGIHALARPFGFGFLSMAALLFSNLRTPRGTTDSDYRAKRKVCAIPEAQHCFSQT